MRLTDRVSLKLCPPVMCEPEEGRMGVTQKCGAEKASLRKAVKGSGLETEWGRGREWRPCQRPHRETNAVQHVSSGAR